MATPGDRALLTVRELGSWLDRDVGPALREETEAVAHGGTALTMLRLKASTKDVDLGFRLRELGNIVYDPRLHVRLSVRRLEKNGYLRTLVTWAKGDLYLLLGKDLRGAGYAKQEY